ncbi:hypothetical protein J7443_17500 [Tropicibacter sp. R15_0]|uniref:CHC2 zinc finger domain-containing protein n=1 Tax=Tropicibacter sp. R15_0 TaxID=2821101 RepID=UPI001ADB0EF9|nr:CHC2 zinc finger domain-containing protein [Tropicibacter sp. R15_0]MBO9467043.1 hypothetical protein [Tropicibacter sp. R15_0]
MALSDEVKAKVSLRSVAERYVTWDQHKSTEARGDWWAPCPFHGEKTSSFHVTEKGGAGGSFYCFGCQERGSVIDFMMAIEGIGFADAVKRLADSEGVSRDADPARLLEIKEESARKQQEAARADAAKADRNHERAREIWRASIVNHRNLIRYLEGRGIRLDAIGGVPPTLRYHPNLPCYEGQDEAGRAKLIHSGPAMVAFIGRNKLIGVHRTWIDPEVPSRGRARLECGRKVPKQMLGLTGQIVGNPVLLSRRTTGTLLVGEGIETVLAALAAALLRNPNSRPFAEAALTLDAMAGPEDRRHRPLGKGRMGKPLPSAWPKIDTSRPGYLPPDDTDRAVVLADPSTKCPETARLNAERAAKKIGLCCKHGARLAVPNDAWDHDEDFADLAMKGTLYDA